MIGSQAKEEFFEEVVEDLAQNENRDNDLDDEQMANLIIGE